MRAFQLGALRRQAGNRHLARIPHLEFFERLFPTEPDRRLPQQFGFAGQAPSDITFRGSRLGFVDRLLADLGSFVMQLAGQFLRHIEPQLFHAAESDVVEKRRVVLHHARLDTHGHQLSSGNRWLATFGRHHQFDRRRAVSEREDFAS